jgi:hypothetical protein
VDSRLDADGHDAVAVRPRGSGLLSVRLREIRFLKRISGPASRVAQRSGLSSTYSACSSADHATMSSSVGIGIQTAATPMGHESHTPTSMSSADTRKLVISAICTCQVTECSSRTSSSSRSTILTSDAGKAVATPSWSSSTERDDMRLGRGPASASPWPLARHESRAPAGACHHRARRSSRSGHCRCRRLMPFRRVSTAATDDSRCYR